MLGRLAQLGDSAIEGGWLAAAFLLPVLVNPHGLNPFDLPKTIVFRSLTLLMLLAWAVSQLGRDGDRWRLARPGRPQPLLLAALAYGLSDILATAASLDPRTSFWGSYERLDGLTTRLGYLLFFALVTARFEPRRHSRRLVAALLSGAGLAAVLALGQHLGLGLLAALPRPHYPRLEGTLGNPIFLGAYLSMVIPLTLATLSHELAQRGGAARGNPALAGPSRRWPRPIVVILAALLALQLIAAIMANSRGAWLGLLTGLTVYTVGTYRRRCRPPGRRGVFASLGLVVIFLALPAVSLVAFPDTRPLTPDPRYGTARQRVLIWQAALTAVVEPQAVIADLADRDRVAPSLRPVVGYGLECSAFALTRRQSPDLFAAGLPPGTIVDRAHNLFLDRQLTNGALGSLSLVALLAAFFYHALRKWPQSTGLEGHPLALGLTAAVAGYLVQAFFEVGNVATEGLFWLYLGLAAATTRRSSPTSAGPICPAGAAPANAAWWAPATVAIVAALAAATTAANVNLIKADTAASAALRAEQQSDWAAALTTGQEVLGLAPDWPTYHAIVARAYLSLADEVSIPEQASELGRAGYWHLLEARRLEPLSVHWVLQAARGAAWLTYHNEGDEYYDRACQLYEQAYLLAPAKSDIADELNALRWRQRHKGHLEPAGAGEL